MHRLLERQIHKHLKGLSSVEKDRLEDIFEAISDAYEGYDQDRGLMERSLELSSKELRKQYYTLKKNSEQQKELLSTVKDIIGTLEKGEPTIEMLTKEYMIETLNDMVKERLQGEELSKG